MSNIINIASYKSDTIDLNALLLNGRKLADGLISAAKDNSASSDVFNDHAAEPIKDINDIRRISEYLLSKQRYRDNMLFIIGINFGLRASDLRMLRFSDIINDNFTFKESFPVFEIKTRNTRKKKKNRYIGVNTAVIEAVTLYLKHTRGVSLSDYMFRSESSNGTLQADPITVRSIERMLKRVASAVGLDIHVSTHTLRKTFCYHQMLMSHNDTRKLLLLQKMLNHSSPVQTLDYIGITAEEIEDAYRNLNLGSKDYCYVNCQLEERADEAI